MKRVITVLLLGICAVSAFSGISYTATTTTTVEGQGTQKIVVQAYVSADKARIEFKESDNPVMGNGTYLITTDNGETMYLVNPQDKTYMAWNMSQLGTLLNQMGGMVKLEFTNVKVNKISESAGPTMLGKATKHYRFDTSYDLDMKIMGIKQQQTVETEQQVWATNAFSDAAMQVWLRNFASTSIEGLDKLIKESMAVVDGVALKTITNTTTRQYNRKRNKVKREQKTTAEMVVTEMKNEELDPSLFEIPAGFQKMEGTGEDGKMPSFKDMFKSNN